MTQPFFELLQKDGQTRARLGKIKTAHGTIDTPAFMPVGTRGCVKAMTGRELDEAGAQIILGNTYHLMLRPGMEVIDAAGGLHSFSQWNKPMLTDSGGFQVFSLASMNRISEQGVHFQSHIDGSKHFLGPKESMAVQKSLGADIAMAFDECSPYPCSYVEAKEAMVRTHRWAQQCLQCSLKDYQKLFGIVQGGVYEDLRKESAAVLKEMDFAGYALGGLSVGEPAPIMYEVISYTEPLLPEEKPRYLMGVGTPRNLIEAVRRGIDLFDCVMPTRNARNGTLFTWSGKLSIKAGRYAGDMSPVDSQLDCYASSFSKAYLRHLLNVGEITGMMLATQHNIAFYLDFMRKMRHALQQGSFDLFYQQVCQIYPE